MRACCASWSGDAWNCRSGRFFCVVSCCVGGADCCSCRVGGADCCSCHSCCDVSCCVGGADCSSCRSCYVPRASGCVWPRGAESRRCEGGEFSLMVN